MDRREFVGGSLASLLAAAFAKPTEVMAAAEAVQPEKPYQSALKPTIVMEQGGLKSGPHRWYTKGYIPAGTFEMTHDYADFTTDGLLVQHVQVGGELHITIPLDVVRFELRR